MDPRTITWTKLVKDHYVNLHTEFLAAKPSGSEEEVFFNIFLCIFMT